NGELSIEFNKQLAAKVYRHTAHYDAMIANYFTEDTEEQFPERYTVTHENVQTLRYGENPHKKAAFYKKPVETYGGLTAAKQLHRKEHSYNNIQDANAAIEIVSNYSNTAIVALKYMNPLGIGITTDISLAL